MSGLIIPSPVPPSYKSGYAHYAAESAHPGLWEGLAGAWCPALGNTGGSVRSAIDEHHAVLTNMNPSTDWGPSKYGTVIDIDGADDYLTVTHQGELNWQLTDGFACSAWINMNDVSGEDTFSADNPRTLIDKENGSLAINYMVRIQGGKISFLYRNAADTAYVDETMDSHVITAGVWHHVTAVHNGSAMLLYLDGVLQASTHTGSAATTDSQTSTQEVQIGQQRNNTQRQLNGKIASLFIYFRPLHAAEIITLYRDPLAPFRRRRFVASTAAAGGDPEGSLIHGKLIRGGLLKGGVLIG